MKEKRMTAKMAKSIVKDWNSFSNDQIMGEAKGYLSALEGYEIKPILRYLKELATEDDYYLKGVVFHAKKLLKEFKEEMK